MATTGRAKTVSAAPAPRPGILAFPAPSLARFGMVAVALVVTGAFTGIWLHLELRRDAYLAQAVACRQEALRAPITMPEPQATARRVAIEDRCRSGAERERAGYMLGGALLAAAAAAALVFVTPLAVQRRDKLRELSAASAPLLRRTAELSADMGLPRPVKLRLGRSELADAYAYGWPGVRRIALPRRLLDVYPQPAFDAVMRHELAHLRHGDVEWSALAGSAWYAVGPMLAVPVVVAAAGWGRSVLPDYLWRLAALAIVVELVVAAALRAREHDADLAAGRWRGPLRDLVADARDPGGNPWYRRGPFARHPSPPQRLAVLDDPGRAAAVPFTDALLVGFLASTTVALVFEVGWTALAGTAGVAGARLGGAVVGGVLLGTVMGLAFIRWLLVDGVAGRIPGLAPAALGAGLGVPAGQLVGIAGTGTGQLAGLEQPLWLLLPAAFATGATLLSGAMAALIAGYAGRTRGPRALWLPAALASVLAYTVAIWIAGQAQLLADGAGVKWLLAWTVTVLPQPAVLPASPAMIAGTLITAVAVAALVARGPAVVPAWLATSPSVATAPRLVAPSAGRAAVGTPVPDRAGGTPAGLTALATAIAAGGAGAAVVAANRVLRGAATTGAAQTERLYTVVWIAAIAVAAVTLALSVTSSSLGPALAAAAGPVALGTVLCGLVVLNLVQGYLPSEEAVWSVGRHAITLGTALSLLAATAALFGRRGAPHPMVSAPLAGLLTATLAGLVAAFPAVVVPSILLTA